MEAEWETEAVGTSCPRRDSWGNKGFCVRLRGRSLEVSVFQPGRPGKERLTCPLGLAGAPQAQKRELILRITFLGRSEALTHEAGGPALHPLFRECCFIEDAVLGLF